MNPMTMTRGWQTDKILKSDVSVFKKIEEAFWLKHIKQERYKSKLERYAKPNI